MPVLVVFAHPMRDSFTGAVLDRVLETLTVGGVQPMLLDLYREGYSGLEALPLHNRQALESCTQLVLVYPTWWSTQPALLSSWLAQAFDTDLTGIEQILCFVTHGGTRLGNWLSGRAGRRFVATRLRRRCAPGARLVWIGCYGLDGSRAGDRARYLDHARRQVQRHLWPGRRPVLRRAASQKTLREGNP